MSIDFVLPVHNLMARAFTRPCKERGTGMADGLWCRALTGGGCKVVVPAIEKYGVFDVIVQI